MIKNLILSGGALRSCSHIGCIKYLEEQNALDSIDTFIGTSAGSLVSFCVCLGMKSNDMRVALKEFIHLQKECPPNIDNLLNIFYTMGATDGEVLLKFVSKQLQKYAKVNNMSFIEFAKFSGKNFVVYAARLPTLDSVYFSVDTTPDLDIATAIRASCSLPLVFTPVRIKDDIFIDAGLVYNFPFDYVKKNRLHDTLGVNIRSNPSKETPKDLNIGTLFRMIIDALMRKANQAHGDVPDCMTIIDITMDDSDGLEINFDLSQCAFQIPDDTINDYIDLGYRKMKETYER